MSTSLVIFGIVIVLIALYVIVYIIYPGPGNNDVLPKSTSLAKKNEIYYSDMTKNNLLATAGASVLGFFKIQAGDRTQKATNAYTPLISIDGAWTLEILPSPKTIEGTSARLRVAVQDGGSRTEEIIELPSIPRQTWVFIGILRDGRRFDIIYNNQIVASHRLAYYPVVISSPLSVGANGLDGTVQHVLVNSSRLTPYVVEKVRLSYVDTNGNLLESNPINNVFPNIKLLAECPPGLPCNSITSPPQNNLMKWETPYA